MAADIKACQAKGKIITLSIGGASTGTTNFTSNAQAKAFAKTIWNLFLGGSSSTRPFGHAVLDGWVTIFPSSHELYSTVRSIDLDVEGGSSNQHMATFVKTIRHLSKKGKKRSGNIFLLKLRTELYHHRYYITGAPECNFPNPFYKSIINTVPFDALYVQVCSKWLFTEVTSSTFS